MNNSSVYKVTLVLLLSSEMLSTLMGGGAFFAKSLTYEHSLTQPLVKTRKGLSTELSVWNIIFLMSLQFDVN